MGRCVGDSVGASVVGENDGSDVGSLVGCSDGARVAIHNPPSICVKPSRHPHSHSPFNSTAIDVSISHKSDVLQGASVGMCVGFVVGARLGFAKQLLSSDGSGTSPSWQSQT